MKVIFEYLLIGMAIFIIINNIYVVREISRLRSNSGKHYPFRWGRIILTSFIALYILVPLVKQWLA